MENFPQEVSSPCIQSILPGKAHVSHLSYLAIRLLAELWLRFKWVFDLNKYVNRIKDSFARHIVFFGPKKQQHPAFAPLGHPTVHEGARHWPLTGCKTQDRGAKRKTQTEEITLLSPDYVSRNYIQVNVNSQV